MTFHQKLGTMEQKQERVAKLATTLAQLAGLKDIMVNACRRAAELCKADFLTGMVGEFPTLQGVMGGEYAGTMGRIMRWSSGIGQHYQPHSMEGAIPADLDRASPVFGRSAG